MNACFFSGYVTNNHLGTFGVGSSGSRASDTITFTAPGPTRPGISFSPIGASQSCIDSVIFSGDTSGALELGGVFNSSFEADWSCFDHTCPTRSSLSFEVSEPDGLTPPVTIATARSNKLPELSSYEFISIVLTACGCPIWQDKRNRTRNSHLRRSRSAMSYETGIVGQPSAAVIKNTACPYLLSWGSSGEGLVTNA